MALVDVVRAGVAIANTITKSFQAVVTHQPWIGQSGSGVDIFAAAIPRRALVDRSRKAVNTSSGSLVMSVASLTFLDPVENTTANAGQQRTNPIDPRDIITLDDGVTAPIVKAGGFEDAGNLGQFVVEVTLG